MNAIRTIDRDVLGSSYVEVGSTFPYRLDVPTAGIVVIGNEVLSAKVDEKNAKHMAAGLRAAGIDLTRIVVIRDDVETIAADVASMAKTCDHLFTSGGVGATHDDVTMEGIAKALGRPLIQDPYLTSLIEGHYSDRPSDAVMRMAMVPRGSVLLGKEELLYPVVQVENIFVLPGVPEFLRAKFDFLLTRLEGTAVILRQIYVRAGEAMLADLLEETSDALPTVEIGSYPRFDIPDYRVKITVESRDAAAVDAGVERVVAGLDPADIVKVE